MNSEDPPEGFSWSFGCFLVIMVIKKYQICFYCFEGGRDYSHFPEMGHFFSELVTCNDWDPPWMNHYIKYLIVAINDFHKKFVLPSTNKDDLFMFKNLQNQLIQSIYTAKQKYFNKISKKLCDPLTSTNCYWSLLKTLLNGKKVPCIPPFLHNSKYIADLKEWHFLTLFSLVSALSYQTTAYYQVN